MSNEYYVNENGEAVFPEGITEIPDYAFEHEDELEIAVIPETVEIIGHCAFYRCKNLKKVVFPSGLKEVKKGAFTICKKLKNVRFPYGLERIGALAFSGTSLEKVFIPDGMVWIGYKAFACTFIKKISFPEIGLFENIEADAFYGCPIQDVIFRKKISSEVKSEIKIQELENWLWHSRGYLHCNGSKMEVFVTPSYCRIENLRIKKVLKKKRLGRLLVLKCSRTFFSSSDHIEYIITDSENPDIGYGIGRNVKEAWASWTKCCSPSSYKKVQ